MKRAFSLTAIGDSARIAAGLSRIRLGTRSGGCSVSILWGNNDRKDDISLQDPREARRGRDGGRVSAEDTKLGRAVAIKVLPQHLGGDDEAKKRFIQEAKAASALDHPNICTIHEIDETEDGQIFMVMAFYEGRTVKEHLAQGPLDIARAVDIAIGVARGLERAHERGIVHRDIKPANIMVTSDGVVKIMDFGIAKLAGEATITRTGSSIGTVAVYVSRAGERRGRRSPHRHLVARRAPLRDAHGTKTLRRRLRPGGDLRHHERRAEAAVRSPSRRARRSRARRAEGDGEISRRAISKRRGHACGPRIMRAFHRRRRTRRRAAAEQEHLPSIAVLPFKDMSPQQDQEYFCEGIAEELLNALVQIEGLRVAARTSSAQFKDKAVDVRAIGRELGVQSVLEGSVRKSGDRLRITAQLINVEDGYHLFSEKYDRTADDIFAIQDEISLAIVDKLKVKLLHDEKSKLVKRHTENEEAYRLYLQGRYFWNRRHEGGVQRGLEYFQKAIAIDPEYALPYSGIADCYFSLGFFDFLAPKEAFGKCKEAALKALEMDPDLAEAHASLAIALQFFDWDWPGAEAEFRRAIGLNPNYATVHYFYGVFLTAMGRFDDAIAEQMRAMELDPIQPIIRAAHAFTLWVAGRNDEAIANSRALTEFDPNFFVGWLILGLSCAEIGRFADAEDALRKADDLTGGASTLVLGFLGYVLGLAGKRDEARSILNRLLEFRKSKYASAELIAIIVLALRRAGCGL